MISVVIPTVKGREDVFGRVRAAYERDIPPTGLELIFPPPDQPTVGVAWQRGAEVAEGEYIHLANDDCEPWPGWWKPAIEAVERGFIPSPQVYTPGGYPQGLPRWGDVAADWTPVSCALIPFFSREQWDSIKPLFTGHYHTDNFITERARRAGYPCVLRTGYAFTHHWAQPKRGAGMSQESRMAFDEVLYRQAMRKVEAGDWNEPWPPDGGCHIAAVDPPLRGEPAP